MAITYSFILPNGEAAKDVANWLPWPIAMVPMSLVGLFLASRIWNATPKPTSAAPAAQSQRV
jgi:OPA family glycerol-3-phosphate transporter-like MFS transporter